jgi:ribonucrease Y
MTGIEVVVVVAIVVVVAVLAAGTAYVLASRSTGGRVQEQRNESQREAERRLAETETASKQRLLEAQEEAIRIRTAAEEEARTVRQQVQQLESRVIQKEENLERRSEELSRREQSLGDKERGLDELRAQLDETHKQQLRELERVAGMTRQEAHGLLLEQIEQELQQEMARRVRDSELAAREESDRRARAIVTEALQRVAADQTAEISVSVLPLPNDEIKGRIIGREGRNIRALQQATGIDIIVDDTPEAVIISGFDPVRREVARTALNKLIVDGRIHPARIEETVAKARQEVLQRVKEEGEAAVLEIGLQGLHPEVVRHMGILRFRTSYGQQVLAHSKEVAYLARMMAHEIGADVRTATMAGFLHDIGKAIDHEVEGSHAVIGADLLQRNGVPAPVVHAVRAHHYDEEPHTVEAVLLIAADAISAARPGARRETLEAYIKRLEKLEEIANSFQGVQQSYAIQAGREVRIIVKPEQIDDASAQLMARNIANRIEGELSYPGQIRVTVVRETRAIEYAR